MVGPLIQIRRRRLLASAAITVGVAALHLGTIGLIALLPLRPSARAVAGAAPASAPGSPATTPSDAIPSAPPPLGVTRASRRTVLDAADPSGSLGLSRTGQMSWDWERAFRSDVTAVATWLARPAPSPPPPGKIRVDQVADALAQLADAVRGRPGDPLTPRDEADAPGFDVARAEVFGQILMSLTPLAIRTAPDDPSLFLDLLTIVNAAATDPILAASKRQLVTLGLMEGLAASLDARRLDDAPESRARLAAGIAPFITGPSLDGALARRATARQTRFDATHDPDGRPTTHDPPLDPRTSPRPAELFIRASSLVASIRESPRGEREARWRAWSDAVRSSETSRDPADTMVLTSRRHRPDRESIRLAQSQHAIVNVTNEVMAKLASMARAD